LKLANINDFYSIFHETIFETRAIKKKKQIDYVASLADRFTNPPKGSSILHISFESYIQIYPTCYIS
jgi:hypothetical protein